MLRLMHPTRLDITEYSRVSLCELFNHSLACVTASRLAAKHAHWNVTGMGFKELHELFDEIAAKLDGLADTLAERCATLGGLAYGTLEGIEDLNTLPAAETGFSSPIEYLVGLADMLGDTANHCRNYITQAEELDDKVSADIFTGISGDLDKLVWLVEAHLRQ